MYVSYVFSCRIKVGSGFFYPTAKPEPVEKLQDPNHCAEACVNVSVYVAMSCIVNVVEAPTTIRGPPHMVTLVEY